MSRFTGLALLACLAAALTCAAGCGKRDHDAVMDEFVQILEEMAEVAQRAETSDSAKADLDKLSEKADELAGEMEELGEPSESISKDIEEEYGKRIAAAYEKLKAADWADRRIERLLESFVQLPVRPDRAAARQRGARRTAARARIATLEVAIDAFEIDVGRCPTTEEGLDALVRRPSGVADGWTGPYLRGAPLRDPWGNDYVYRCPGSRPGQTYEIICYGRDGQPGGTGEDADIGNRADDE